MNSNLSTKKLVYGALIAALYAVLTIAIAPLSYGAVQVRISEILTVIPFFSSFSILGLTIGCLTANLLSPIGILDIIFGTLATFLSAFLTYKIGKSHFKYKIYLAPLPAVIINGIVVGILINISLPSGPIEYLSAMALIAFEEMLPCYILGLPLLILINRNKNLKKFFNI